MTDHRTPTAGDVLERLSAARPVSDGEVDAILAEHGGPALARVLASPGHHTTNEHEHEHEHAQAHLDLQARRLERREKVMMFTPARRSARRRHTWAVAATGIAAAATVALVLSGQPGSPGPGSGTSGIVVATESRTAATAPAGITLIALASAARAESSGRGAVAYTASTNAYREDPHAAQLTSSPTRLWKAPDGSGRLDTAVTNAGQGSPPAPQRDDETWAAGGSPDGGTWRAGVLDGLSVANLPSTAQAMAAAIRTWAQKQPPMIGDGPGTIADTELGFLGALLAEPTATPAQRAAAFEVLAARDDVGLLGDHNDPLGRAGTAVEYDMRSSGTYRVTLTFDGATSTLLSREDTLITLDGDWQSGTPLGPWSWTAWTTTTTVDAVGDTPAPAAPAGT